MPSSTPLTWGEWKEMEDIYEVSKDVETIKSCQHHHIRPFPTPGSSEKHSDVPPWPILLTELFLDLAPLDYCSSRRKISSKCLTMITVYTSYLYSFLFSPCYVALFSGHHRSSSCQDDHDCHVTSPINSPTNCFLHASISLMKLVQANL